MGPNRTGPKPKPKHFVCQECWKKRQGGGADMVTVAAPGEALVTTYPGDHYASVSGTSFSAALVSGAADVLMYQASSVKNAGLSQFAEPDVARALRHANACVTDGSLGGGCFDMSQAMAYIQSMIVPPSGITPAVASIISSVTKK